jgi:hypothetical protein
MKAKKEHLKRKWWLVFSGPLSVHVHMTPFFSFSNNLSFCFVAAPLPEVFDGEKQLKSIEASSRLILTL